MKRKTLVLLTIISFLLLATLGVSVAIFSAIKNGSGLVSIRSGDISFKYTEVTGIGNGINIEAYEGISDDTGKVLNTYFDFKIEANLVHSDMIYEVSVEPVNNSIPLEGVKIYLTEIKNNDEIDLSSNYNGLGKVKTISNYDNYIIYQERILRNVRGYEKNFRVRIWLSEDVDIYTNDYMNKSGGFRINVKAVSNHTMVDSKIPVPNITGGTGTTWTTQSQTIKLADSNPVIGGVTYEYYVTDNQEDIPNDLTIATGTTDNLYSVNRIGKNYIYYRTVLADNTKSNWSNPQIVYYDNNTYTITYNLNGGSQGENPITSYNVETETFNLPTPTRVGYTFGGWYEDSNFNGEPVTQVVIGTRGNKTYYAKLVPDNVLDFYSSTRGYPGNRNAANTVKRTWSVNTYVSGMADDNYYVEGTYRVSNFSITSTRITVTSGCGYGLAFVLLLDSNVTYKYIQDSTSTASSNVVFYASDGTYLGAQSLSNGVFTVPSNAYWTLYNVHGGGSCGSNATGYVDNPKIFPIS